MICYNLLQHNTSKGLTKYSGPWRIAVTHFLGQMLAVIGSRMVGIGGGCPVFLFSKGIYFTVTTVTKRIIKYIKAATTKEIVHVTPCNNNNKNKPNCYNLLQCVTLPIFNCYNKCYRLLHQKTLIYRHLLLVTV